MAVIVTVKALHTLFSREKHVEVVLMISVGNVFNISIFYICIHTSTHCSDITSSTLLIPQAFHISFFLGYTMT